MWDIQQIKNHHFWVIPRLENESVGNFGLSTPYKPNPYAPFGRQKGGFSQMIQF